MKVGALFVSGFLVVLGVDSGGELDNSLATLMTSIIPITLVGNNLGARHRHLNSLVDEACYHGSFSSLQALPELSPIDRLFKIDLASKQRNVDYIIENLKDGDMLYVSRALKSIWLLESQYCHVISPSNLECNLYPKMTTTAANKMNHWIQLNLRDAKRCEEFYQYYCVENFNLAIKFFWHCSNDFILSKVPDILHNLTPHYLKIICEKCPEVAKIFFDSFQHNQNVLSNYLNDRTKYYKSLRCLLKLDADIFLDITEKYFDVNYFHNLNPEATKYIMSNFRSRFNNKPELYTAWLLDINTLAKCLSKDEIKDVIIKLAKADYLGNWFSYKKVEPLIKGLNMEERSSLKKQVFVDKSFGVTVEKWPYEPPSSPESKSDVSNIFEDRKHHPGKYEDYGLEEACFRSDCFRSILRKKCKKRRGSWAEDCKIISQQKTHLEQLFDHYRYASFEKTMSELRRKMLVENLENRQDMMLVLVSKSGGRAESVEDLLRLLTTRHANEPVHVRATVIRSLIRRASVWRLPQLTWDLILKFGSDLGLDGRPPAATCKEGLHAVVLRNILNDSHSEPVWRAFLNEFSTFAEYSLTAAERRIVSIKLPALLLSEAEINPQLASEHLEQVLNTLDTYKVRADRCSGFISAIAATVRRDSNAQKLLSRLFNARIARRELFKENFAMIQTGSSYLNVLKHDADTLAPGKEFKVLIEATNLKHDRFLRSLALYFNEKNGLAEKYLSLLEHHAMTMTSSKNQLLARPLALLLSADKLISLLQKLDSAPKKSPSRRLARALRGNVHLARPLIDLEAVGWRFIGARAVVNRLLISNTVELDRLLAWRCTLRLAFLLSMREGKEVAILASIGVKKPKLALKTALLHLKRKKLDPTIWDVVLQLITKLDDSGKINDDHRLRRLLEKVSVVPGTVKPSYCIKVYEVLQKIAKSAPMPMLCEIENILPGVDEEFIKKVVINFFTNELTLEKVLKDDYYFNSITCLHARIIAKYLLLSKCATSQKNRIESVGELFFDRIEAISQVAKKEALEYLDDFVTSLKYTKVFLDTQYVSSLPVFEWVIKRMQRISPIDLNFQKYVHLHLTMLYFKTIRQSVKNNPHVFDDLPKEMSAAVEIVGVVLGKYIAHEVIELSAKYFRSILELYKQDLLGYLQLYFIQDRLDGLFASVIRGMLEGEDSRPHVVAEYIYAQKFGSSDSEHEDILKQLKENKNEEVQFFLFADFHSEN